MAISLLGMIQIEAVRNLRGAITLYKLVQLGLFCAAEFSSGASTSEYSASVVVIVIVANRSPLTLHFGKCSVHNTRNPRRRGQYGLKNLPALFYTIPNY